MYYNEYEDYMRNYMEPQNPYMMNNSSYFNDFYRQNNNNDFRNMNNDISELYPEIFRKLNPIICRMCNNNTKPISKELVENMTNEVYNNIEISDFLKIYINVETRNPEELSNSSEEKSTRKEVSDSENRESIARRRPNNPLLRDLIRILIINQLLRRRRPRTPYTRMDNKQMFPDFQNFGYPNYEVNQFNNYMDF